MASQVTVGGLWGSEGGNSTLRADKKYASIERLRIADDNAKLVL